LKIGGKHIRLAHGAGIEAGTYLKITQGATTENVVVGAIESPSWAVTLDAGLANNYALDGAAAAVTVDSIEFTIAVNTSGVGPFARLSMDPRHSRYVINFFAAAGANIDVTLAEPVTLTKPPNNLPLAAGPS